MRHDRLHSDSAVVPCNGSNVDGLRISMRTMLALLFGAWLVLAAAPPRAIAAAIAEDKLKSAFLYNFTKFVEWPAERFANAADPIVIGLLADASMAAEVATITAARHVNGRPLLVQLVDDSTDLHAVHVLFVDSRKQARYARMQEAAGMTGTLVVGDSEDCAQQDVSICFVQQGEKLRFEINVDAAERAHLKISAQLQKLAVVVRRGP